VITLRRWSCYRWITRVHWARYTRSHREATFAYPWESSNQSCYVFHRALICSFRTNALKTACLRLRRESIVITKARWPTATLTLFHVKASENGISEHEILEGLQSYLLWLQPSPWCFGACSHAARRIHRIFEHAAPLHNQGKELPYFIPQMIVPYLREGYKSKSSAP